jgi:hypothetical protein
LLLQLLQLPQCPSPLSPLPLQFRSIVAVAPSPLQHDRNRSIIAVAPLPRSRHWGNRRQWQWGNGTVIIAIAIDRSIVCVLCVCVGRANTIDFYSVCFIRNVSECQMEVRIKGVTYLVDYFG